MIGERLKERRKDAGLTQEQFAKKMSITTAALQSYEQGINTPDDELKIKFARYFNISLDYLIGAIDEELALDRSNVLSLPFGFPPECRGVVDEVIDLCVTKGKYEKQAKK